MRVPVAGAPRRSSSCSRVVGAFLCAAAWFTVTTVVTVVLDGSVAALVVHKYSTRVVRTKYGPLRGVMMHIHPPVEAFLGVPYATPPVGSLR